MKMMSIVLRCVSLQCIILVCTAVAEPIINVSPSKIIPGLTSSLDINCTFSLDYYPDMAAFISLDLSRANAADGNFEDVATITEFTPDSASVLTQEQVAAGGVLSQTGESFLHLILQFPTVLQAGVYLCTAHLMDGMGENSALNTTSSVTVEEAKLDDAVQTVVQVQTHESDMENAMSTMAKYIETLENDTMFLENEIKDLQYNLSQLEDAVEMMHLVSLIGRYQNKSYYISNYGLGDVTYAMRMCVLFGGQLTEIEDEAEYWAIQKFLTDATGGFHFVVIAGSDERLEGNWVFQSDHEKVPYVNWFPGRPLRNYNMNCLMMWEPDWDMIDDRCFIDPKLDYVRFLCEIDM